MGTRREMKVKISVNEDYRKGWRGRIWGGGWRLKVLVF
jgi:hypothetical protein